MNIDLRTLILALCIIYFLQSFVFFFQFLYNRKYNGIGDWSIGSALIGFGFLFILLRDIPSLELVSILVSNMLLLLGIIFLYTGVTRFFDKRERRWLISAILIIYIISSFYFTYVNNNITARIVIFSFAAAILLALIVISLWIYRIPSVVSAVRILAAILLAGCFFFIIRALGSILLPPINNFFSDTLFQSGTFFIAIIFNLMWTFFLTDMVNQRLNAEASEAKIYLEEEKELLKTTLFSIADGVIVTDTEYKIVLFNQAAAKLSGWAKEEAENKPLTEVFNIIDEFSHEKSIIPDFKEISLDNPVSLVENIILLAKDGGEKFIEYSVAPISSINSNNSGVVVVFRDLSAKRARIEVIEYLSYHDQLTGLYNRHFFEEELRRLDTSRNLPLTVIMGDVNGLKLCNDAFGHAAGDKLLKQAAEVMQAECRSSDIVARIGGDEFVILLEKTNWQDAEAIVKRINMRIADLHLDPLLLSVSFGCATKNNIEGDISIVLKQAEDNMYKHKLTESLNIKTCSLHLILQTLRERSATEQYHMQKVSELCAAFGEALKFDNEAIKDLRELGLMHDIGKIVLDNQLLDKKGPLSIQERREIERHAESGYRILNSVNEFVQMSEYVLASHEHWDGNGYPRGLKGEEIPLYARILAVADAFETLTSDRPYRAATSPAAAIAEIKNCAGKQFDPYLVKVLEEKVAAHL
jgi:diguanylate cyclase (GGDEF)-like protein/PAS domain S-box-containing protein